MVVLQVIDPQTKKTYEINGVEEDGYIPSTEWKKIVLKEQGPGLMVYDPFYYNTSVAKSSISYSDPYKGKLYYRGYDMETLAENSNFLDVSFLLIHGSLPSKQESDLWKDLVMSHTYLHEDILAQLRRFRYNAHPMGIMIATLAALMAFHPEANPSLRGADLYEKSMESCNKQIFRILGKVATIAACAYRMRVGRPFNSPDSTGTMSFTGNFLAMLDRLSEPCYIPDERLSRLLDKVFIVLADDGMNCATSMLRHVASSKVDPYTAISTAAAAHYGPRISGVSDAVIGMLSEIPDSSSASVRSFLDRCKSENRRLQGFGHLNYKAYDPRARVLKGVAKEVAELLGRDSLLDKALELERQVLEDVHYTSRGVYPNIDLYLSLIWRMMGFPSDFAPVLSAVPRTAGWLAHWKEGLTDPYAKIWRPRQIYKGEDKRDYIALEERQTPPHGEPSLDYPETRQNRRRLLCYHNKV
ncbi:hypothetical protein GpartN1_g23.t1 [Galdieria partita]|uniref:Citrate synthase n=1 Tax=Galdieria partita TaxID=83374 RepID=A0A9C7PR54_9RHOD|nr:hypothetical protein GpartN1_g23.t1 [Galdieria partita]